MRGAAIITSVPTTTLITPALNEKSWPDFAMSESFTGHSRSDQGQLQTSTDDLSARQGFIVAGNCTKRRRARNPGAEAAANASPYGRRGVPGLRVWRHPQ